MLRPWYLHLREAFMHVQWPQYMHVLSCGCRGLDELSRRPFESSARVFHCHSFICIHFASSREQCNRVLVLPVGSRSISLLRACAVLPRMDWSQVTPSKKFIAEDMPDLGLDDILDAPFRVYVLRCLMAFYVGWAKTEDVGFLCWMTLARQAQASQSDSLRLKFVCCGPLAMQLQRPTSIMHC